MLQRLKESTWMKRQEGKAGYILAWLVGIPLPILVLVYSCAAATKTATDPSTLRASG